MSIRQVHHNELLNHIILDYDEAKDASVPVDFILPIQGEVTPTKVRNFFTRNGSFNCSTLYSWSRHTLSLHLKLSLFGVDPVTSQQCLNIAKEKLIAIACGEDGIAPLTDIPNQYPALQRPITGANLDRLFEIAINGIYDEKNPSSGERLFLFLPLCPLMTRLKYAIPLQLYHSTYSFMNWTATVISNLSGAILYITFLLTDCYLHVMYIPFVSFFLVFPMLISVTKIQPFLLGLLEDKLIHLDEMLLNSASFYALGLECKRIFKKIPFFRQFVNRNGSFDFNLWVFQKKQLTYQSYQRSLDLELKSVWIKAMKELVDSRVSEPYML
jgi:hypothetical protein